MEGFVYLIYDLSTDHYKIGISALNPNKRKKQLQTGNSEMLTVKYCYKSKYYKKIERTLHNLYSHKRIYGEWFELNNVEVFNFLSICCKLDKNFNVNIIGYYINLIDKDYFCK